MADTQQAWAQWLAAWRAAPGRKHEEVAALAAWADQAEVTRVVGAWAALQLEGPFPQGPVPSVAWEATQAAWGWFSPEVKGQVTARLATLAGCAYAVAARVVETGIATGLFAPDGRLGPAGERLIQFAAQQVARPLRGRGRSSWGSGSGRGGTPED